MCAQLVVMRAIRLSLSSNLPPRAQSSTVPPKHKYVGLIPSKGGMIARATRRLCQHVVDCRRDATWVSLLGDRGEFEDGHPMLSLVAVVVLAQVALFPGGLWNLDVDTKTGQCIALLSAFFQHSRPEKLTEVVIGSRHMFECQAISGDGEGSIACKHFTRCERFQQPRFVARGRPPFSIHLHSHLDFRPPTSTTPHSSQPSFSANLSTTLPRTSSPWIDNPFTR